MAEPEASERVRAELTDLNQRALVLHLMGE